MKTIAANLCALALALFAFAPLASAVGKPPELLSYQGYLVDANGVPLGTNETGDPLPANYDVLFRIYSASSGGTLLWAEEQTITVDNGYFSVLLGEGAVSASDPRPDLSTVFTGIGADERFVGVSVRFQAGGEFSEILPRLRLLTSPYSFLASQARSIVNPDGQSLLTAEGGDVSVAGTLNATTLSGSGGGLTNLNASQVSSGTIADARLSGNVAKLDSAQTFTQRNVFSAGLAVNNAPILLRGSSDGAHGLQHRNDVGRDGPYLWGFNGGTLATSNGTKALQWYDNGNVVVDGAAGAALGFGARLGQHINLYSNSYGVGIQNGTMYFRGDNFAWYRGGSHNNDQFHGGGGSMLMKLNGSNLDLSGRLHVTGWFDSHNTFAYFNGNNHTGIATTWGSYSIWANQRIAALEFNAMSDARIKEVVGLTDPVEDLATIRRLRVTDYYSVDKVAEGDDLKKGFIAQEVAEVIPEAVSLTEQFIPNIYALPTELEYDEAAKELRIVLSGPHGLEEGDRVRILTSDTMLELAVASVNSPKEFVLGSVAREPEQVFVYGKQVSDFRTVHYDRIFTTGIGAIQELAREVDALKRRTAELEEELSRMHLIEGKLAGLQATVDGLASLQAAVDTRKGDNYAADGGEE